jgi:hypothetical protein
MSFNEDDSWGTADQEGTDPFGWGTFTFDGDLLTLSVDSESCYATGLQPLAITKLPGTYEAAFTAEGDLELSVVEDRCGRRVGDLTGTLVPYSP